MFNSPDEVREGENWRMELVNLAGGAQVGRMTLQRVWKWSRTSSRWRAPTCYGAPSAVLGEWTIHVMMADGTEIDSAPGEITLLPPGHDAWVVGDEPVVAIDWQGASVWAVRS